MMSASVSLSVSGTVHVSGAGPDVYPLTSLQSVSSLSSLAVAGILVSNIIKTSRHVTVFRNLAVCFKKLSRVCPEIDDIARAYLLPEAR